MTTTDTVSTPGVTVPDQTAALLNLAAGYVGHRTVEMGLRAGLLAALADSDRGMTSAELAQAAGTDDEFTAVWCRAAFAAGVLDGADTGREVAYRLAPHMETLLLDRQSPAYVGGIFAALTQPEVIDEFAAALGTGEQTWWDRCSPQFIDDVAAAGAPFYTRLIPGGLEQVPGLGERLADGITVMETACGTGSGLVRMATLYPACTILGVDGDAYSLQTAERRVSEAGLAERVELLCAPLEDLSVEPRFDLIINSLSMHECRDIDQATTNLKDALRPGGYLIISDFPFPDSLDGLRTLPGRVMSGIQYFEARIGDQLLPVSAYQELLDRHGFEGVGSLMLAPVHAVTYGRA